MREWQDGGSWTVGQNAGVMGSDEDRWHEICTGSAEQAEAEADLFEGVGGTTGCWGRYFEDDVWWEAAPVCGRRRDLGDVVLLVETGGRDRAARAWGATI